MASLLGRPVVANILQKKEQQKADNADAASGKKRKVKAAELRVHKGKTRITRFCCTSATG